MDLTSGIEKMSVGHPPVGHPPVGHPAEGHPAEGRGAPCQTCQDICSGFQPHSWRKACMACHCSLEDHAPSSDLEDDHRMGRLLADSKYAHLTAKVKGGAGLRVYKRNRMIITNPVVSRKDPTFNTITYDWAPPGLTQKLAMQYMELLPEEKRPVAGTEGALYRRRQLLRQLPVYDHDPAACQGLSEQGARDMAAFIRSYKDEALGVGEVALPGEGGASREGGGAGRDGATKQKNGKGGQDHPDPPSSTISNGIKDSCKTREYFCSGCGEEVPSDSPVVYAERAGYEQQWHPTCFRCSQCSEALVDLVYFWKSGTLLCGRHYCQSSHSRCAGCDQLLFSEERHTSPDGQTWHKEHFCCWRCGQSLEEPCSCPH